MADENNGDAKPQGEDSKGQPPVNEDSPSDNKPDVAEKARREQQSKKDKVTSEKDELDERLGSLEMREAERARDSYVAELLSDKKTYTNVDASDPMFKYATSKEEVEEIAKQLQNKYMDLQQNALQSVQSDTPQQLTDEQIEQENKKLEEITQKEGKSTFSSFYDNLTRRKR